jgi:hypothetical protein
MTPETCNGPGSVCIVHTDTFQQELSNLARNSTYNNKQRRFHSYEVAASIAGFNYRQKLPECVEQYIKARFSEQSGEYTGFE